MLRFIYVIFVNLWRIFYYLIKMEYMARHTSQYTLEERYAMDRKIVNMVIRSARIQLKADGMEHLPDQGGYLMVSNHQGKLDALAFFQSHTKPMSFVMDEAKSHVPLTSQFLRIMDGVPLVKGDLRQSLAALRQVGDRIAQGAVYLIFPEGGYNDNRNNLGEFLPGAFKAALYSKAPIVPVALVDTYKPFAINSLRPVTAQIHYLEPIPYEEYRHLRTPQIAALCRARIDEAVRLHTRPACAELSPCTDLPACPEQEPVLQG